jgi:hypothetical protein
MIIDVVVQLAFHYSDVAQLDRPHLLTELADAKQPVDLRRMFNTVEGTQLADAYWAMAISGPPSDPSPLTGSTIKSIASKAAATKPTASSEVPSAMPKYFDGVQAMGPYVWQQGLNALNNRDNWVVGGHEGTFTLALCRAPYQKVVNPGKLLGSACNIGWGGKEVAISSGFEVLVRALKQPANAGYFPTDNWRAPSELPAAATFHAGSGGQNPMRACRAQHNGNWHPGKEVAGKCNITWGGTEIPVAQCQVLSLYNTAAGGNRNGN